MNPTPQAPALTALTKEDEEFLKWATEWPDQPDEPDILRFVAIIRRLAARVEEITTERDALRSQSEKFERRLTDATKAGTPYWSERDTMNAYVLEISSLRQQLADRHAVIEAARLVVSDDYSEPIQAMFELSDALDALDRRENGKAD